jgi:E3 ubiquitin-protein ligase RNF14
MDDGEDQRHVELSSLEAIFPEIQKLGDDCFRLELPVNPATPVTVTFPAASTEAVPATPNARQVEPVETIVDSHELSYLPAIVIQMTLPDGYPTERPPQVKISTWPQWLPGGTIQKLEDDCVSLWEDIGRDLVAFTYIDHIQQAVDDVFGLVDSARRLEVDSLHKIAILDYDTKAKRVAFEKETYECGVCLGKSSLTYMR